MAEHDDDVRDLRTTIADIAVRLARVEVKLYSVCDEFRRYEERNNQRGQRVPVLLLGAISATSSAISILFQMWISRSP